MDNKKFEIVELKGAFFANCFSVHSFKPFRNAVRLVPDRPSDTDSAENVVEEEVADLK